jgi:hypothetical protein
MWVLTMSEMTCQNCLSDFEEDDIVWADIEEDIQDGFKMFNNFVWCVSCLPNQKEKSK